MARTRQQEAALRAARMMQDEIYRGIGATDRPDVEPDDMGDDPRAEARDMATSLTRGGTQPLRDELARGMDEEDSQTMSRGKMGMGGGKGGTRVDVGPVTVERPMARGSEGGRNASDDDREEFRRWQAQRAADRAAQRRARAAGDVPKLFNRMDD